jgi:hypothetical protein
MFRQILVRALAASALVAIAAPSTLAIGYWNLPGNFCQCVGCGFGAGHHTSLVLGPADWNGFCAHNEVRLPYASSVPYSGCGTVNCGQHFAAPTLMEPMPAQPVAPAPLPLTRRPRPLFLR